MLAIVQRYEVKKFFKKTSKNSSKKSSKNSCIVRNRKRQKETKTNKNKQKQTNKNKNKQTQTNTYKTNTYNKGQSRPISPHQFQFLEAPLVRQADDEHENTVDGED